MKFKDQDGIVMYVIYLFPQSEVATAMIQNMFPVIYEQFCKNYIGGLYSNRNVRQVFRLRRVINRMVKMSQLDSLVSYLPRGARIGLSPPQTCPMSS